MTYDNINQKTYTKTYTNLSDFNNHYRTTADTIYVHHQLSCHASPKTETG